MYKFTNPQQFFAGSDYQSRLELVELDVCSEASVNKARDSVKTKHGSLYGLINNAGGTFPKAKDTIDLNTYAPIRVTETFLPLIQEGGRVVQVSSASGPNFVSRCSEEVQRMFVNPGVTFKEAEDRIIVPYLAIQDGDMNDEDKVAALEKIGLDVNAGTGLGAGYGVSKACLNAYTMEIARKHPNLLINSCTPGFIETDLTRGYAERSGKTPQDMGMKPIDDGAKSAVYLMMADLRADIPDYESGRYYGSDAVRSPLHKYRSPGDPPYNGEYP